MFNFIRMRNPALSSGDISANAGLESPRMQRGYNDLWEDERDDTDGGISVKVDALNAEASGQRVQI